MIICPCHFLQACTKLSTFPLSVIAMSSLWRASCCFYKVPCYSICTSSQCALCSWCLIPQLKKTELVRWTAARFYEAILPCLAGVKRAFMAQNKPTGAQLSRSQQSACVKRHQSTPVTHLFMSKCADLWQYFPCHSSQLPLHAFNCVPFSFPQFSRPQCPQYVLKAGYVLMSL